MCRRALAVVLARPSLVDRALTCCAAINTEEVSVSVKATPVSRLRVRLAGALGVNQPVSAPQTPGTESGSTTITMFSGDVGASLPDLDEHLRYQLGKHKSHTSPFLQRRHAIILTVLTVPTVASIIAVAVLFARDPVRYLTLPTDYAVSVSWGILGALVGGCAWLADCVCDSRWSRLVGSNGLVKNDVQWGTFRCNMLSCILIGVAHNLLLFRRYFPFAGGWVFPLVVSRFITSYCGSQVRDLALSLYLVTFTQSSFAGLIDETSTLFHSKAPFKAVARNLAYNLFLGLIIFLIVVFSVRILFFFR